MSELITSTTYFGGMTNGDGVWYVCFHMDVCTRICV
jgi:hypothetical protein